MSQSPQQLFTEALDLPLADRGRLAALLIESLESDVDEGVDEAWSKEISRRVQDIDAGRVRMIPGLKFARDFEDRMPPQVEFHPLAADEAVAAKEWYFEIRPLLAEEFDTELERLLSVLLRPLDAGQTPTWDTGIPAPPVSIPSRVQARRRSTSSHRGSNTPIVDRAIGSTGLKRD